MNSLSFRAKAIEGSYFKAETDQCLLERAASLGMRGRGTSVVSTSAVYAPTAATAVDMLPEVLAHHLPVDVHRPLASTKTSLDYQVHTPKFAKTTGVFRDLTRKTYVDSITLGSSMNTGRSKWAAGTLTEAPGKTTTLWSVGEAQRLMLDGADNDPHREKRLRYVNPPRAAPIVVVGSTPFRLLPDPTPGRAFFWGTILAVFVGAGSAKLVLKSLEVEKVSDLKVRVAPLVSTVTGTFNALSAPVKAWRNDLNMGSAMDSKFSRTLKSTML